MYTNTRLLGRSLYSMKQNKQKFADFVIFFRAFSKLYKNVYWIQTNKQKDGQAKFKNRYR